ncbi:guanylate kinase isoform X1 [Schistocerca americana]|nr:guanylate kinase isoform X1 [Schistocerca americana]XP_047114596.1 guanylate kinase isoform X1 [Schistocerca piceifrons]XP_047114597.1 guanylate kinase isoform X1 [Schistocerca piceifrons]XP_049828066.1 guanylate kinase-like isoform X1 [Schistocerca gregaria]XP_049828067.1 guanylate kinase-like isoform X1 [Schistocerca gregaria]XP_049961054.1 guanylate kinase isoform X1 [Schistocerca serialis cubense]
MSVVFVNLSKICLNFLQNKISFTKQLVYNTMVKENPKAMVICGPSGCGKSTLLKKLFDEFPDKFGFSVSHTTRSPRSGEVDGVHYNFTTKEAMKAAINNGEFLESAEYNHNLYGTSKAAVEKVSQSGKICVLDIEIQGVKQIKQTSLKPLYVFIKPPSLSTLEERLRGRGTESEESLQRRLTIAATELEYGETPGNFDIIIVNDVLEKAYSELREFVLKELQRCKDIDGASDS